MGFRCAAQRASSEGVKSREDPSCEYIVQVETPLLCGHPDFEIPSAQKQEIVCYPFEEEEFVDDASLFKATADIEAETDAILSMVGGAARHRHEQRSGGDDVKQEERMEEKMSAK